MLYTWDQTKNRRNIELRSIDFAVVHHFEWNGALVAEDTRQAYGEKRYQALGMLSGKLHVLIFTPRNEATRVISLRRANKREEKIYEKAQKT